MGNNQSVKRCSRFACQWHFDIIDWSFFRVRKRFGSRVSVSLILQRQWILVAAGDTTTCFGTTGTSFEDGETGFSTVWKLSGGVKSQRVRISNTGMNGLGLLVETEDRNGNTTKFELPTKTVIRCRMRLCGLNGPLSVTQYSRTTRLPIW